MTENDIEQVKMILQRLQPDVKTLLDLLPPSDPRGCFRSAWRRLNRASASGEVFGFNHHVANKGSGGHRHERTEAER
jgi:hypothetical protein